jgi:hypothetical protein
VGTQEPIEDFIQRFVRNASGAWECVAPAEIDVAGDRIQVTPGTRFTRGTKFMGVDLAKMLDEQYEKHQHRR